MRVFLTGASGFIGAQVARLLLDHGHEVAALVTPDQVPWRLTEILGRLTLIEGRLGQALPELTTFAPEACLHLAWYAVPGKYLTAAENITLVMDSLALLQRLIEVGCKQVVMVGTCGEYDTDAGYLREGGETKPMTLYAAAKLSLSLMGTQVAAAAGVQFAWARLFYLYGPMEDKQRLVPALINALGRGEPFRTTPGEQIRDYLHVADVAAGLVTLIEQQASGVYNIASGVPISIRTLVETIGDLMGHTDLLQIGAIPYRNWEPPFICGDNSKLRALGWQPRYRLRDGLQQTIAWWA